MNVPSPAKLDMSGNQESTPEIEPRDVRHTEAGRTLWTYLPRLAVLRVWLWGHPDRWHVPRSFCAKVNRAHRAERSDDASDQADTDDYPACAYPACAALS